jgi:hypothetical protein
MASKLANMPIHPEAMSGVGDSLEFAGPSGADLGMTYRQWVAGLCAAGQLSHPSYDSKPEDVARHAVECADALIEALEKPK